MLHKAINQALSFYHLFFYFYFSIESCRDDMLFKVNLEVSITLVPLIKGQWDFRLDFGLLQKINCEHVSHVTSMSPLGFFVHYTIQSE